MDTIFTKIIKREIPAHIVYEDDLSIAFLDISPITKGHTLLVSKTVYTNFLDVPEDVMSHLMSVAKRIANATMIALDAKGFNLLNNNGAASGQEIFHFHLHIIPRYDSDELNFSHKKHETSPEEHQKRADLIRLALL